MDRDSWNARYRDGDYLYGTEPNDFLRAEVGRIPKGRVLCLAEGEGRNAVFLAKLGYEVTGVDFSATGLRKAETLAKSHGVKLRLIEADLATFDLGIERWHGIVSMWAHTQLPVRQRIHAAVSRALIAGGAFVLEAYRPEQLAFGTGGPKDVTMLPTIAALQAELAGLELVIARDVNRDIREGTKHGGPSATVQLVGIRR